ncbi:aminodeoxychorismate/anthranilate synthase component II [Aerococcus agrisoli]|uniref:Aminodeoxychorismate/anthranilate synthase component II n=1 Tax=Aerococcus agrisoli TaxID=2487350 RepID=A0A3N4G2G1_9LACT|nr:aminodeoxychorismate/anthranilate synthase component II [Aerococcus agrisoli]RPA55537.1 aminodeoxychorismate/anthranilate synthase component II [Aerococcus agrisoli]
MILLIDNYDSFTYNLYQYIGEVNTNIQVVRNDEVTIEDIETMTDIDCIILSPGPGVPEEAGICVDVIKHFTGKLPILGICLGHQAIGYAFGANVVRAQTVKHGKTSMVDHNNDPIFKDIANPFQVMRYHSLIVEEAGLPEELEILSKSIDDDAIMAIKHRDYDVYGLEYHPESIYTPDGQTLIKNFLEIVAKKAAQTVE